MGSLNVGVSVIGSHDSCHEDPSAAEGESGALRRHALLAGDRAGHGVVFDFICAKYLVSGTVKGMFMSTPPSDPEAEETPASSQDAAIHSSSPATNDCSLPQKTAGFHSFVRILSGGIANPGQIAEYIEMGNPVQYIDEFGRYFQLSSDDTRRTREAALADLVKLTQPYFERWSLEGFDGPQSHSSVHSDDIIFERNLYGIPTDRIEELQALRGKAPKDSGSSTEGSTPAGIARQMRSDHEIWSIAAALVKYLLQTNASLKRVEFDMLDQDHEHGMGILIKVLKSRTPLQTDEETISRHLRKAITIYKKQYSSAPNA